MSMKKKLALCATFSPQVMEEISKYCEITPAGFLKSGGAPVDEETLLRDCQGFEMVALSHEKTTERCIDAWVESGMKFITCCRGTPSTVPVARVRAHGLPLCHAPGRNAEAVAEFTFGVMLGLMRSITRSSAAVANGLYLAPPMDNLLDAPYDPTACWFAPDGRTFDSIFGAGPELFGRTLGVVGYGSIGTRVARIAKGFGMRVLAYDVFTPAEKMVAEGVEPTPLEELFGQSDVVTLHLPVTPDTIGMINKSLLDRMKPTAYLINTSRAVVVNQRDFVEALSAGRIAGAALDVFWTEPLPANHPILAMDNVLVTPHMAGVSQDIDRWTGTIAAEDILHYCKGEPLCHIWRGN